MRFFRRRCPAGQPTGPAVPGRRYQGAGALVEALAEGLPQGFWVPAAAPNGGQLGQFLAECMSRHLVEVPGWAVDDKGNVYRKM